MLRELLALISIRRTLCENFPPNAWSAGNLEIHGDGLVVARSSKDRA